VNVVVVISILMGKGLNELQVQRVDGLCHDLVLVGSFVCLVEMKALLLSSDPIISFAISSAMRPGCLYSSLDSVFLESHLYFPL